jgi:hypothetical protein
MMKTELVHPEERSTTFAQILDREAEDGVEHEQGIDDDIRMAA